MRIVKANFLALTGGTLTGDLSIGSHKLKTTTLYLHEKDTSTLSIHKISDNSIQRLYADRFLFVTGIYGEGSSSNISAQNVDASALIGRARDTGNDLVETDRRQGAADPYFQATLPMVLNPSAEPGALVEGHFWYDATDDVLKYRDSATVHTLLGSNTASNLDAAGYRAFAAIGDCLNPERINDNNIATSAEFDTIGEYAEVAFGRLVNIKRWRIHGNVSSNGDGRFKIQKWDLVTGAWVDWVTGIPTRTTNDWSTLSTETEVYTTAIRLVCTTVDGGTGGDVCNELEVIY